MFKKSLVAMAALLLAACGGGGGKLTGQVQFAGGGDASGVTVALAGGAGGSKVAVTGADGAYAFEGVGDGTYSLTFEAGDTVEGRKGLAVVVKDGKAGEVPAVGFTAAATVSGKVTAGAASGNLGIQVAVAGTQLSATTADDGSFRIAGVPSGQRVLVATRGGYVAQSAVTVQRGAQDVPAFVLGKQAVRPGTLSGSVRYWDMRSSADVTLSVPGVVDGVRPAADGSFSIPLPEGTWELVATAPVYPRQVVARAAVTGDARTDVGVRILSGAHRFAPNQGTQTWATSMLTPDGEHALVSREGWQNVTHSIVDLRTGAERAFLVEWEWLTDGQYDWALSADGRYAVYARSIPIRDESGNRRDAATFHLVDTVTGQLALARGQANTSPSDPERWSFSADGAAFFGTDNRQLHRLGTATGEHVAVAADVAVLKGDAEHYLAVGRGAGGAAVGSATFLGKTGEARVVSATVQTDAALLDSGAYGLLLTDCEATDGGEACVARSVDLRTGEAREVSGGRFPRGSTLAHTDHSGWARIQGARNVYVRLATGEAYDYAPGFTASMADGARIDPAGNRIAFTASASPNTSLYLAPMPFTAIPTVAVDTGTESYSFAFLAPGRLVATSSSASRLVRQVNDTRADVTDGAVPGSVKVSGVSAAWRRASDNAWVAITGTSGEVQLSDADPDLKARLNYNGNLNYDDFSVSQTKDARWTLWTVFNGATGRFHVTALEAGAAAPKRFADVRAWGDASRTSFLAGMKRHGWNDQEVVVDLESGVTRQIWERDVDGWDWGRWDETGAADHLVVSYLAGRTVQQYDGSDGTEPVYETSILKY